MNHAQTITTLTDALRDVPAIRGLFLSGSFGAGLEDAFSDIDFVLVTPEGASDAIAAQWRAALEQTGDILLWWDRAPVPVLINAITQDWTRTDVVILKPEQLAQHSRDTLKPLFDHDALYDTLPASKPRQALTPARFTRQVEDFIRILGLMHLSMGREEYLNGVLGLNLMRNALVDLLIEETAAPFRGGILHLNRLITDDQKALLSSLPPAVPDRDALIAANLAYAAAYLPRARAMAAKLGANWPDAFETATWAHLERSLGMSRPYSPSSVS